MRAEFMGFVFQNCCLIPELDARENVEFAARIAGRHIGRKSRERAGGAAGICGARGQNAPPAVAAFGRGEAEGRVARALMNEPAVILADEPTGNLDERTGEAVMQMLLSLCSEGRASLLLITHNPDFARRTSRSVRFLRA